MQFLRTLFWVVLAIFLSIIASNNWRDVTVDLWGDLQADIKIPVLMAVMFLVGFLPPYLILRGKLWRLNRRLSHAERRPPETTAPASGPMPVADEQTPLATP